MCLLQDYKKQKKTMKATTNDRVDDLIKYNKALSCSALYLHVEKMMANSKDIIEAQKCAIKKR